MVRKAVGSIVACWMVAAALMAQPLLGAPPSLSPEALAGLEQRGAALVEAINAPDVGARRAIAAPIFAPSFVGQVGEDRVMNQLSGIRERFGRLEFHHAELSEAQRGETVSRVLHVFAKSEKSGRWQDLQTRVDPEAPYLLREIAFIAEVSEPVALPNGDIESPETAAWLNEYIDRLIREEGLSGSVLLERGGEIVFERHFGFADEGATIPVTAQTRFNLGSGNKMFTALAVMMLEGEGKLRLDDPIGKYFEDFPDKAAAGKITIAHLLSHTSGIAEYWTAETAEAVRAAAGSADLLALVYRAGMRSEPGAVYEYSNSNFVLAGLIIERAAGVPYDDFIRARVTGPLGLRDTDTFMMDGSVPGLAQRLTRNEAGTGWRALPPGRKGGSAGGGYSTARDMLAFSRALTSGRIVPLPTLKRMTTSQTPDATRDEGDDYGFGFILQRVGNVRAWGHGGIARGVNFEYRRYPDIDATLITFSNQDNGAYDDLRRTAEKLLIGVR